MSATGREVIDVLESHGELEWFRYTRIAAASHIPVTVWRFKSSDTSNEAEQHVITSLRETLAHFHGGTNWALFFSGRNWVLAPRQLRDLEESGQFRTDSDVIEHLLKANPSLSQIASQDLVAIAIDFARRLRDFK